MSLRTRLGAWLMGGSRAFTPPSYFSGEMRLGMDVISGKPTSDALLREFLGWQAIAAGSIANRIQSLPLEIVETRRDTDGTLIEEVLDEHPLVDVLQDPNPLLSTMQIMRILSLWIVQLGEGYLLKVGDRLRVTRELWPLEPQKVTVDVSDAQAVQGYFYQAAQGRREVHYMPDEVIRFWNPHPAEIWAGMGNIGPQAISYDAQKFLSETLRGYYQNDATPRTALVADETAAPPDADTRERFKTDWMERYSQRFGKNRGVPAFLPPGFSVHEFESLDLSHQVVMLNHWRDQILMANGVPRSVLGDVVDANRAAAETNQLVFDRYAIQPIASILADGLTRSLAREFGRSISIRFCKYLQDDEDFRLREEQQDLALKVRSINLVREDRGLDPVEWGELPVGSFGDTPYDGSAGDNPFTPQDESMVPRQRSRIDLEWRRQLVRERSFEPPMLAAMRRIFDEQEASVLEALRKPRRARADPINPDDLFDPKAWRDVFKVHLEPVRVAAFRASAEQTLFDLAPKSVFIFREVAREFLNRQGAALVQNVNATTRDALRRVLVDVQESGAGVDSIAREIRKVFEDASRHRAKAIARTEVLKASQGGQLESFGLAGVERKQWNTSRDERVRDSHHIDGQVRAAVEPFVLDDGEAADAPGLGANGGTLSARNSINCRCFVTPVLE